MKDGITEEMQAAFRAMFKPELRQFALMLMGRYDEAVKVTRKRNKITFPLKSEDFERTPAEKKVYDEWVDWVFSQSDESGQTKWCLNKEQMLVISKLPKGEPINIIRGPPGTGKSLRGACCIWALLAAGSGEGKILVVASSNEATDAIARKITETRPKDGQWGDNLMIRLHVESAEYHYARAHADTDEENHPVAERCNQESERVRNIKATFQVASLHEFTTDKMQQLSDSAKQAHVCHIALHGMSLAEAIWKETSNIWHALEDIPANERSSDENKAIEAAISYRGVLKEFRGELLDSDKEGKFRNAYQFLAKYVMKKASIVITTCHNVASYRITKWFQPNYLVADEAGQLTDAELIIAATACKDLRQILLLGGLTQLEPIVTSTTRNEFSWARKSTFMGRVLGHVDSTHLWVQYRMTNVIAKPLSIFFYKSLLRNAVGLDIPGPQTLMIRRFISEFLWKGKKEAGKVEEMVFVDLPNSRSWKDVDGESRINMPEAKCIVDMIAALFNFDTALVQRFTLAVICMYKS